MNHGEWVPYSFYGQAWFYATAMQELGPMAVISPTDISVLLLSWLWCFLPLHRVLPFCKVVCEPPKSARLAVLLCPMAF